MAKIHANAFPRLSSNQPQRQWPLILLISPCARRIRVVWMPGCAV